MTKPVDLDALDAAQAAATPGEWEVRIPFPKFPDLAANVWVDPDGPNLQHVVKIERNATATATAIAALHNAYPAMAAEIRALREVAEAARAFVPTCERVIYGGATTRECGAAATHESQFGVVLCDLHRSNVPRPLDPHPRVDALRAALAKVPR